MLNPALLSKINWTQLVAAAATILVLFGIELSPEQQVSIVAGIGLVSNLLTTVFRTWFTGNAPAK